jgi:gliding motility-associated-like protein
MKTQYSSLALLLLLNFGLITSVLGQCPQNIDFEQGNFTGWSALTGSYANPLVSGFVAGRQTIMTGGGFDVTLPFLPVVSPNGGTYSVKLGNEQTNGEVDVLRTTFLVTPTNTSFYYEYAVILQSPGHALADQPSFEINITDQNGQLLNCGNYLVAAGAGVAGFQKYGISTWDTVEYKNWSGVNVDLTAYIGQNITVEFKTKDCNFGGHYGYAYIDISCTGELKNIGALCQGDSVFQLVAPGGFESYLWNPGGFVGQSLNVQNATPGQVFTVELTPFGNPGCRSYLSDTVNILVYETVSTTASCPDVHNGTATLSLLNDDTLKYTYAWATNPIQTTLVATGLMGGYDYVVQIRNSTGCLMRDTVFVDVLPLMTLRTSTDSVSCYQGSDGQASVVEVTGANGNVRYRWNSTPIQDVPIAVNLSRGGYQVQVTDEDGCIAYASVVIEEPTDLMYTYQTQIPSCYGFSDGNVEVFASQGTPPYTYTWNTVSPVQTSQKATGLPRGVHTFVVTDFEGCQKTATIIMNEPPPVHPPVVFYDTVCSGDVPFLKAIADSGLKIHWYPVQSGSVPIGSGNSFVPPAAYSNEIYFAATQDEDYCYSNPRVPVFVTVRPLPATDFYADRNSVEVQFGIVNFSDNTLSSAPIVSWFWDFGDGYTGNVPYPSHQYEQIGDYNVSLTTVDSLGCSQKLLKPTFVNVTRQVNLVLPNAFTPNGDGINDFFQLEQKLIKDLTIKIFDRWGNMVYQSNDMGFRWDGSQGGKPLEEGTYVFQIKGLDTDNVPVERSGSVTLIR